jgi:hypothetical protein
LFNGGGVIDLGRSMVEKTREEDDVVVAGLLIV